MEADSPATGFVGNFNYHYSDTSLGPSMRHPARQCAVDGKVSL
jgi:hypothetical protein